VTYPEDQNIRPWWRGDPDTLKTGPDAYRLAISRTHTPLFAISRQGKPWVTHSGAIQWKSAPEADADDLPLLGFAPPLEAHQLGDAGFKTDLGLKYAYLVGAMANGITSVEMLSAAGQAGMVGFFGAGGLSIGQIAAAIDRLEASTGKFPYGFNLIHSPNDMRLEMETAQLYLDRGIHLISASAYLGLTLPLIYYRVKGIHRTESGHIICPNRVIAKISRVEVAAKFFSPPPQSLLSELVQQGKLTRDEATLAEQVPVAQDITAEADSGGHTDNRPALSLLPTILSLRDEAMRRHAYRVPLRVGLAGGIATPHAVAAAFSMGAAYILTGSINQAAVEADTSDTVRQMLVEAQQADVIMAPAADMFELGVKVQVLKRGTMFAMRAAKLYDLYQAYSRFSDIPEVVRTMIERDYLKAPYATAWQNTRAYFESRDPSQIERAEKDAKHQMALVFRSYLGQSSLWAKAGVEERKIDFQIWCGPSMGAFNAWVKGTFLEPANQRKTAVMALQLLSGATKLIRFQRLVEQGVAFPPSALDIKPSTLEAA
jgi:trans-AT polyketide synthase/acyltransferase/oxidoreductase domain-containing protein